MTDLKLTEKQREQLLELIEEAFRDGFHSTETYNDSPMNTAGEEWEKSKPYFIHKLQK